MRGQKLRIFYLLRMYMTPYLYWIQWNWLNWWILIGKEHALAIGKTLMSTEDITKKNKGIGVENFHYLNDGLWNMKKIKA